MIWSSQNSLYINIFDIDIPYVNIVGLQKNGKFACPVCGPKIKYSRSKSLRNEVFDEYRHFLSKNYKYGTTERNVFNGKQETTLKPQRMTPHLWKLHYNKNRQGGMQESSYKKCYAFYYYYVLFTIIDIDFCNFFINYDS